VLLLLWIPRLLFLLPPEHDAEEGENSDGPESKEDVQSAVSAAGVSTEGLVVKLAKDASSCGAMVVVDG